MVYLIIHEDFDGDCMYSDVLNAYSDKLNAEEFIKDIEKKLEAYHAENKIHWAAFKTEVEPYMKELRKARLSKESMEEYKTIQLNHNSEQDRLVEKHGLVEYKELVYASEPVFYIKEMEVL